VITTAGSKSTSRTPKKIPNVSRTIRDQIDHSFARLDRSGSSQDVSAAKAGLVAVDGWNRSASVAPNSSGIWFSRANPPLLRPCSAAAARTAAIAPADAPPRRRSR
jgi:hypothetical protein